MQQQKKIMPSFNKNKRPRQALFAHPNNENHNNVNANFRGNFPSSSGPNHRPANKQPRMGPNSQNLGVRQPMNDNYNNGGRPWNGMPNNSSRGNFAASTPPNPWSSSAASAGYGFGGGASPAAGAGSMNDSWQRWAGVSNPPPPSRPPTPVRAPQVWGGPAQAPQPRFPPPQPNPPTGTFWQQNSGPHRQLNAFPPQTPRPSSANKQLSGNAEKQQSGFVVDDRSLKVLTASIADVGSWSQHMDKIGSMICEVFGVMNSAISSDVRGVAKKFTLKNEDQTLKCIFYETDRSLPKLTRDQWLRCMGSMEQKSGLFRCVSIRPASQAERQVMTSLIAASSSTMRERLAAEQEP
ncbi:spermatogenesis-associated protein 22-like [Patiria miniata]|uniref:Uncharacterized protein n=1 Tax=Patiria miniata TaxID=46514 RepID=A0A913ZSN5_PATMI|nr:spermatogenesis-associated protein 22-like [Patiria miniata]